MHSGSKLVTESHALSRCRKQGGKSQEVCWIFASLPGSYSKGVGEWSGVLMVLVVNPLGKKDKEPRGSSTAYLKQGIGTTEAKQVFFSHKVMVCTKGIWHQEQFASWPAFHESSIPYQKILWLCYFCKHNSNTLGMIWMEQKTLRGFPDSMLTINCLSRDGGNSADPSHIETSLCLGQRPP